MPSSILSFGSAALLLQLLVVYTSAALHKLNPVWTSEFSGVYYALNCDPFVSRLGLFVREYPEVMKMLTASTFAMELCGPGLLLVPVANRWIRMAAILAFGGFHLGLAITMTLGLFPWICLVCWFLFVPGMAWDRVARLVRPWLEKRRFVFRALQTGGAKADVRTESGAWPDPTHSGLRHRLLDAVAGCLLIYAILWNLRDVFDEGIANRIVPERWNAVARALGLEKGWSMFAPVPRPDDGWPVYRGTLHDGTEVNLWQPDQPLPWEKPPVVSDLYKNQRWRRYLENLTMESYAWYRPYFADWLQRRWDARYARGRPERRVATVEFLRQLEPTPPPGEPMPSPETAVLWTKHYAEVSTEPTPTEIQEP